MKDISHYNNSNSSNFSKDMSNKKVSDNLLKEKKRFSTTEKLSKDTFKKDSNMIHKKYKKENSFTKSKKEYEKKGKENSSFVDSKMNNFNTKQDKTSKDNVIKDTKFKKKFFKNLVTKRIKKRNEKVEHYRFKIFKDFFSWKKRGKEDKSKFFKRNKFKDNSNNRKKDDLNFFYRHKIIRYTLKILVLVFLIGYVLFLSYDFTNNITLLAVSGQGKNLHGNTINTVLNMKMGTGTIYINLNSLKEFDTQYSIITAKKVACNIFKLDCNKYDYYLDFGDKSDILKGPSAGSSFTLLFVDSILGKKIPTDFAMTGSISPSGIIGNVDGVKEKVQAAIKDGKKIIIIPYFSSYEPKNLPKDVKVYKVMDILGAYKILNGEPFRYRKNVTFDYNITSYLSNLKPISEDLCDRSKEFMKKLNYKPVNISTIVEKINVSKIFMENNVSKNLLTKELKLTISNKKGNRTTNKSLEISFEDFLKESYINKNLTSKVRIKDLLNQTNLTIFQFNKIYLDFRREVESNYYFKLDKYYKGFNSSYNHALVALKNKKYYSAGSFCFNANINARMFLFLKDNISENETKFLFNKLKKDFLNEFIKINDEGYIKKNVRTYEDFYIFLILTDRVYELRNTIDKINLSSTFADKTKYSIAYSIERFYTIKLWELLLKHRGKKISFTPNQLSKTCDYILKDANLKNEYIKRYGFNYEKDIQNIVDNSYNSYYCIYKGLELIGVENTFINGIAIKNNETREFLEKLINITKQRLSLKMNERKNPILPYLYLQYAEDLEKYGDIQSSFLYLNYALSFSNLDYYLDMPKIVKKDYGRTYIYNLYHDKTFMILVLILFFLL